MSARREDEPSESSASARAMDGVRRLVRVLRSSNAQSERRSGITAAQLFVLTHIAEHPGGSLGDVVSRTLTTQSAASEVVARLVARGLVSKSPATDDRRRAVLSATEDGARIVRTSGPPIQEVLIAAFGRLPGIQQEAIARGLAAWLDAAGFSELPPSMFFEPDQHMSTPTLDNAKPHPTDSPMNRGRIEPYSTVNEVLVSHPETTTVFNSFCIDACCGGALQLETVAHRHGIELTTLIDALRTAVARAREAKVAS